MSSLSRRLLVGVNNWLKYLLGVFRSRTDTTRFCECDYAGASPL